MAGSTVEFPWLDQLGQPSAYPLDPGAAGGIERIDTHISHVFLSAERVYKLRRPVKLAFLDFSQPEERVADCMREVTLNRRLAPDVYLGIAPIVASQGRVEVGAVAEAPAAGAAEHCVVMRRLARGRDLKSLLERRVATASQIDRVAARVATFHAEHSLGRPAPFAVTDWLDRTTGPARANFQALGEAPASVAPHDEVEEIRALAASLVQARQQDFDRRRTDGRVVDGHGDLHAEHVWFETDGAEPLLVDCLEFRDDFRCIDAASDVAFLAMDLTYRGHADLAARFLRRYAQASGDYHLYTVVDYFLSYRAMVRAKVASLVATDQTLPAAQRAHASESVRRHLDLGRDFLRDYGRGGVFVLCGTIGTGKTTVAEALADATGGVVISSDRLRAAGRSATARTSAAYRSDRYTDASRSAVYDQMLGEARHVVLSGRTAILDATFSRRQWREAAAEWAATHARGAALIEIVAPREDVLERLAARTAAGNDASEAGPGLYDAIRSEFEEPAEWPADRRARIDTSDPDWLRHLAAAAARLA